MNHETEPQTGWQAVARNPSVVAMIDTVLGLPADREFNKTEFADLANVSRKSVHEHLPLLVEMTIIEPVPGTEPTRYRRDTDSDIVQALAQLDAAVNNVGPFAGVGDRAPAP